MKASLQNLLLILSLFALINARKYEYIGELDQNDSCVLRGNPRQLGKCKEAISCRSEYDRYLKNQSVLKICKFNQKTEKTLICCPTTVKQRNNRPTQQESNSLDLKSCLNRYLSTRKSIRSVEDLYNAFRKNKSEVTDEQCKNVNLYGGQRFDPILHPYYSCSNGSVYGVSPYAFYGHGTKLGDWQDMAALGWTLNNRKIEYKCGGVIISDRFIITAAHCRYKGKNPDTVRVGDRFLETSVDDDHSQQLKIARFTRHPKYGGIEAYNDIAVIKTVEKILFHKYVSPACIAEADEVGNNIKLKIAGYGQTETKEVSNALIEIDIQAHPNSECNEVYNYDPKVPKGVLKSQICLIGKKTYAGKTTDSCNGDSGGPVQYKRFYEVKDPDYDKTLMKSIYEIPMVIGLVSFGTACGLGFPSVNTKISHYREWIESEMRK